MWTLSDRGLSKNIYLLHGFRWGFLLDWFWTFDQYWLYFGRVADGVLDGPLSVSVAGLGTQASVGSALSVKSIPIQSLEIWTSLYKNGYSPAQEPLPWGS